MTKSEWKNQYSEVRRLYRNLPNSAYAMQTCRNAHVSVREALYGWTQIYMSAMWLRPQKLNRVLIHQRMNARIVK